MLIVGPGDGSVDHDGSAFCRGPVQLSCKVFVLIDCHKVHPRANCSLPAEACRLQGSEVVSVEPAVGTFIRSGFSVESIETNPKSALVSIADKVSKSVFLL